MTEKVETSADIEVRKCIDNHQSFALIAGAGSGKTSSLVDALEWIRDRDGMALRQNGQRVACITFTKRAVAVIKERLWFDELFMVSTLHSFLWEQIGRFHSDIREALRLHCLPRLIEKALEKANGGNSRIATDARAKAARLKEELAMLATVESFEYSDEVVGDYPNGRLGHDDIIEIATYLFKNNVTFRRIIGLRFPYIFVDEAQDTFEGIVAGLNLVCAGEGLPIVGYFGDPWQQIYEHGIGTFAPPANGRTFSKIENFRCSKSVIRLLNAFRDDVQQESSGDNKGREGSVIFRLVKAEDPEESRRRYSNRQLESALEKMNAALIDWGWHDREDVIKLFLARQMIARRMGFFELNQLFTGPFASSRAQSSFESGQHFLLMPLIATIAPLIDAKKSDDSRKIIDILRRDSPAFAIDGPYSSETLIRMINRSSELVDQLIKLWGYGTIGEVLRFCVDKQIICSSEKLHEHLMREPRVEEYDEAIHAMDKGDWLADSLLKMKTGEILSYTLFINNNSAYSTQHGVKGEEYSKVFVMYDDIEANWNNYSFGKVLTPDTAGNPTDGQFARGRKMVYVSFSRALEDLRVLLFTSDPLAAKEELTRRLKLAPDQIEIS
ncbi:MAG: ATP-dependent helicase [Magnetococcales bacterium]|nr:ATP-dependent helicase [Magnetococcales bacterium]